MDLTVKDEWSGEVDKMMKEFITLDENGAETNPFNKQLKVEFQIPGQENLGVVNVRGDGFCFWRALSLCMYRNEDRFREIMSKCILSKESDDIISKTWVEFHEIPVISKIMKMTINVVHYMDKKIYLFVCLPDGGIENKEYPCTFTPDEKNVYIYYVPGHYTSLINLK